MVKRLDIGCGSKPKKGYVGIDINPFVSPDILWNAEERLPYEDCTIEAIWLDNSLEHFHNPKSILDECHRILEPAGTIEIKIPNCQWFPLMVLGWFVDLHWFWNWWMTTPIKIGRGVHYSLWTRYTLELTLEECGYVILESRGWYLGKQAYVKAYK
jgi:SAM-dependent methyltransferase